jgi:ParB family chromosome partitioning protein
VTAPASVPRETKGPRLAVVRPVASLDDVLLELIDADDNVRVDVGELDELAASIHELGVIQPIKVTAQPNGRFRVVWGQRRVLACRQLGRTKIPAIVEPPSDVDVHGARRSIEQLSENLQRKDLNPIEEAVALREVLDADPKLTQEALADKLGMSRPWVSNTLGLLEAAPAVQIMVREGRLTASHVKALRGLAPKTQEAIAKEAIEREASAHGTERLVQDHKRSAEWDKERQSAARKTAAEKAEHIAGGVERVVKRIPLDGLIYLDTWYNQAEVDILEKGLKAAGFTKLHRSRGRDGGYIGDRKDALDCSCKAWRVEVGYQGGVVIHEACIVQAHSDAKRTADHQAYTRRTELEQRVRTRLAEVLVDEVATLGPRAARIALWQVLSWSIEDWTKRQEARLINVLDDAKPKRKKRDPWATLQETGEADVRAELVKRLAENLRDGNFKVGWEQLAEELGVLAPPVPAEKPKRAKKAT